MQAANLKEVRVEREDKPKRIMYLAKELLLNNDKINIVAGTNSAGIGAQAAESLSRLGYITYENVKTETSVDKERRKIKLIITVKKTSNFEKLYKENEETRKKKEAEKAKATPGATTK